MILKKRTRSSIGSYYHRYILNKFDNKSIIVNLGGIANFTLINKRVVVSSDIGPANCLIDDLSNYFLIKNLIKIDFIFERKY